MSERAIYFDVPGDGETSIYEVVSTHFSGKKTLEALYSNLDKSWTEKTRGKIGLWIVDSGDNVEIRDDEDNVLTILDYGQVQLLKFLLTELDIQSQNPNLPEGSVFRTSDIQKV